MNMKNINIVQLFVSLQQITNAISAIHHTFILKKYL